MKGFDIFHHCRNPQELKEYSEEKCKDSERISKGLKHKKTHSDMFNNLSSGSKNHPSLLVNSNNLIDYDAIMLAQKEVRNEDIILISLTPKDSSDYDKEQALKAWKRIQERRYFLR
ncbi:hypothetical protein CMI44_01405 [Candidatus Pacearchaeota archaeon]|jgi:hypothetical protein|nr:hypothetical protein [Candidatus Pacearchaeota archaeon]|tara:strand:+ start:2007 stop:2354 length:348 start_codon:yes stop_codon:yes gene_type:complete